MTPLAREEAERRGIKFVIVEEGKGHGRQEESVARAVAAIPFLKYGKRGIVAVAADHGGFRDEETACAAAEAIGDTRFWIWARMDGGGGLSGFCGGRG